MALASDFFLANARARESDVARSLMYCRSKPPSVSNKAIARPSAQQEMTLQVLSLVGPLQEMGQATGRKHPRQWLVRQAEHGACINIVKLGGREPEFPVNMT